MVEPRAHSPSQSRAIIAEAKSGHGRPLNILAAEARAIPDPSYAAEALMALSMDSRLPTGVGAPVLEEILVLLARVEREWRRAEVMAEMAKQGSKWRTNGGAGAKTAREAFLAGIVKLVAEFTPGQARSQAIQGVAAYVDAPEDLLGLAILNGGHELEDGKAVLRHAKMDASIRTRLQQVQEPMLRARLLAFAHHQAPDAGFLTWAVASARSLPEAERLEVLRGMVAAARDDSELQSLRGEVDHLGPENAARLLAALGARADRNGAGSTAIEWFRLAVTLAATIPETKARANVRNNLAEGLARAGATDEADALRALVKVDRDAGRPAGEEPEVSPKGNNAIAPLPSATRKGVALKRGGATPEGSPRHVLALYDTYEGGLKEVHLRAIARAAPLCYAFDLDLALIGFPTEDLPRLLKATASETNIGDGGRYLEELARAKRVHLLSASTKEPPADWSSVGLPVATSPDPDVMKSVDFPAALIAARRAGFTRLCLIMGLGKRGLPESLLRSVNHQLELTGRKVSMETATAMGVIAERLRSTPAV